VPVLNQLKQEHGARRMMLYGSMRSHERVMIDFSPPGKRQCLLRIVQLYFRSERLDTNWFQTLAEQVKSSGNGDDNITIVVITIVVLTGLSPTGRRRNSPAISRLAAIWLQLKPAETSPIWYRFSGPLKRVEH
jgi:hypothetical protein